MKCMFRIPKDGGRVLWEITNKCNYHCLYCIFSADNHCNDLELNTQDCKRVIDDLVSHHYKYLKITGGEPFLRKDIFEILGYAVNRKMSIDISTNASLITKEKAKLLRKLNLKMVHVSLDGHNNEIQEFLRGVNTFRPTINGIKCLVDEDIYVRIGSVINKKNQNNLEDIVKVCEKLKVSEIIFSIMEPVGRMLGDNSLVTDITLDDLEFNILTLRKKYQDIIINYNWANQDNKCAHKCPAGERFIYINNKGNIAPCSWLVTRSDKYLSKLSLKNNSLKEVLMDNHIQAFLEYKKSQKEGVCLGK